MKFNQKLLTIAILSVIVAPISTAENWPTWRGPHGDGTSPITNLPTQWSPAENIVWKVPLPEAGNSTPIVWENKIFLTQPLEAENKRSLMCFDASDGSLLWQKSIEYAQSEPTHDTNTYCSASPVTDGSRVIVWYGSAGVYCYDMEGNELWRKQLGEVNHMWGYAASPVIEGDLCFIHFGPGENHFLVALDKATGEIVWKDPYPFEPMVDRGDDENVPIAEKLRGSWSTPLIIENEDRRELVVSPPLRVIGYDPQTGERLWFSEGLGDLVYASPIWGENTLVALGGFHAPSIAFTVGGQGDITESNRLWRKDRTRLRLGNGVIYEGHLYVHDMGGIVDCVDLKTGELVWRERLSEAQGSNESWSSMIISGDNIYVNNKSGDTFVFKAKPEFELVATNTVHENTNSSLAIAGNHFILRTFDHLWCIGEVEPK